MDPSEPLVVALDSAAASSAAAVGSKAANLARALTNGFRVPDGFCVTTAAFRRFLMAGGLNAIIGMELGRKPLASMRWEEIWDVALRIRSAFLATPIPQEVGCAIARHLNGFDGRCRFAVRSSAPGEDSEKGSFAGLHDSETGVVGLDGVLDALPRIWASLWSDAALLYRAELQLKPSYSAMAVLVQIMADSTPSGVAFAREPRGLASACHVVEAVPGPCADLVDGAVDPDRWLLDPVTDEIREFRPGMREPHAGGQPPLLDRRDLDAIKDVLARLECLLGWPPDMEWTGRGQRLTVLQARPITTLASRGGADRNWYLSLRPARKRLQSLCQRVAGELIPELEALGESLEGAALAAAIEERRGAVARWKRIYRDEFIPFAHGIRELGLYYNAALRPADPYEFVGLLADEDMLAARRNRALGELAVRVGREPELRDALEATLGQGRGGDDFLRRLREALERAGAGATFFADFTDAITAYMDVAYDGVRISERPELVLATVMELARSGRSPANTPSGVRDVLERRLYDAVGSERRGEAEEVLRVGRISWRLRDDDNLLVGRLDSQLLRALEVAVGRLRRAGRVQGEAKAKTSDASQVIDALRDPGKRVTLSVAPEGAPRDGAAHEGSARQLVGQPASPGLASGPARRVAGVHDIGRFRAGDVMVCDAIQPAMTQLVPLASAVVERRGGMLIHGAIIARELGIPCVNGIRDATQLIRDGELVNVDGNLGIVTIGPPAFDFEFLDGDPA